MRARLAVTAVTLLALTGCGGTDPDPVPVASPTPTQVTDQWAVKTCAYLAGQDPYNEFHHDIAATYAGMSSLAELVDLAQTAKQAGNANVLRGWCVTNIPTAGVQVATPR